MQVEPQRIAARRSLAAAFVKNQVLAADVFTRGVDINSPLMGCAEQRAVSIVAGLQPHIAVFLVAIDENFAAATGAAEDLQGRGHDVPSPADLFLDSASLTAELAGRPTLRLALFAATLSGP